MPRSYPRVGLPGFPGFSCFLALLGLTLCGCRGDRLLRVESVPAGATVRLDDRVIGLTPLDVSFGEYGQRRLALYLTGYRTYSEPLVLNARWWSRFPVDILTEVILPLGLDDRREVRVDLVPDVGEEVANLATEEFVDHAARARTGDQLEGVPIAGQPGVDVAPR